jgi:hypothetical protein
VSGVINASLEITVTLKFDPEHEFFKQNSVMSAEGSTRDSLPNSSLGQRYVSGVIQTSLQLTVTLRYDPEVVIFLK